VFRDDYRQAECRKRVSTVDVHVQVPLASRVQVRVSAPAARSTDAALLPKVAVMVLVGVSGSEICGTPAFVLVGTKAGRSAAPVIPAGRERPS
jgi:Zn-dependent alcohol dehydrogenase